jgi:hypothetical protein
MLYAGRMQSGRFQFGDGDELSVIAAALLGGTRLFGGVGTVVGSIIWLLGWNTNGTLASLAITDNITGTHDTQLCSFVYDDLGRAGGSNANGWSVDCGSGHWQQYFSYDAFGNISKNSRSLGLRLHFSDR